MLKSFIKLAFLNLIILSSQFSVAMDAVSGATTSTETRITNVQTAIQSLSPQKPYIHFDLQLSDPEINLIKNININLTHEYKTSLLPENFEKEVVDFISLIGRKTGPLGVISDEVSTNEASASEASKVIVSLVQHIIKASGEETARVQLRSFRPTEQFDIPRWHLDKYKNKTLKGDPYKVVIALRGAPTLYYNLPDNQKEEFSKIYAQENNDKRRQILATFLNDKEAISVAQPNQGTIFFVGGPHAPVHSEPVIKESRLFLGVVVGSKAEFEEQIKQATNSE